VLRNLPLLIQFTVEIHARKQKMLMKRKKMKSHPTNSTFCFCRHANPTRENKKYYFLPKLKKETGTEKVK
jgi:hypothetical protein